MCEISSGGTTRDRTAVPAPESSRTRTWRRGMQRGGHRCFVSNSADQRSRGTSESRSACMLRAGRRASRVARSVDSRCTTTGHRRNAEDRETSPCPDAARPQDRDGPGGRVIRGHPVGEGRGSTGATSGTKVRSRGHAFETGMGVPRPTGPPTNGDRIVRSPARNRRTAWNWTLPVDPRAVRRTADTARPEFRVTVTKQPGVSGCTISFPPSDSADSLPPRRNEDPNMLDDNTFPTILWTTPPTSQRATGPRRRAARSRGRGHPARATGSRNHAPTLATHPPRLHIGPRNRRPRVLGAIHPSRRSAAPGRVIVVRGDEGEQRCPRSPSG